MNKKITLGILILILLLSAFLRIYRISDYMTFLGDEGRDVMVVKSILQGDITFLGPRSSAGDFYMGPAYYYMMTPFLWLFNYDPVGPAIMVALVSVATVFLLYVVGKRFFSTVAGLFAAALYAVSPLVINYSHSSWNPDVLPFFALLIIYMTYKAISSVPSWRYFLLTGVLIGISLQLHYLALFLVIVVAVYIFIAEWLLHERIQIASTIKHYLTLFVGFLIGLSPLLAFEVRHDFPNIRGIYIFIFGDTVQKGYEGNATFLSNVIEVFFRLFAKLLFVFPAFDTLPGLPALTVQLWGGIAVVVAVASLVALYFVKSKYVKILLALWLFICVFLFGFYKKEIFDYHFMLLLPLPFLLVGNLFAKVYYLKSKKKHHMLWPTVSLVAFSALLLFNLFNSPFKNEPNRQKNQIKTISEFVLSKTDNKPFNFALITPGNSDHGYRYYFDILGHTPVTIQNDVVDPKRETVTDQLLVVCEDTSCQPLGNSLFEVAGYGRATISGEWNVSVVKVYRLTPYNESN